MRVLFATTLAHLPQRAGGSVSSTHDLCVELAARNAETAVLARLHSGGSIALWNRLRRKLLKQGFPADQRMGYPTFRGWNPDQGVAEVVRRFAPDVAVVQAAGRAVPIAEALLGAGIPTTLYLRDVEFHRLGGQLSTREGLAYVANSCFTASRAHEAYGVESDVIPPLVRPEAYRTATSRERVLFVNPHPDKGAETAFQLAEARPDIPFQFLESWPLRKDVRSAYKDRARRAGNIEWSESVADMKGPYSRARLVLVPSQWEEAWGRVATEAQLNGIPALAAARGGLPESVGPGGVLVDPVAPVGKWIEALSRLWDDRSFYSVLSERALEHSRRPEIQVGHLANRFLDLLKRQALAEGAG